jgi:hypothetical protein
MRAALFALGIGTEQRQVPGFLQAFADLPWSVPPSSIDAIDERTAAFLALVYRLSNAALTRGQCMRLQHPAASCFISYARVDEPLAQELVAHLEAKGADVWWDLNAITLGAALDETLRTAAHSASCLFLIATPAADRSAYVRLEVETAIRQACGLSRYCPMAECRQASMRCARRPRRGSSRRSARRMPRGRPRLPLRSPACSGRRKSSSTGCGRWPLSKVCAVTWPKGAPDRRCLHVRVDGARPTAGPG